MSKARGQVPCRHGLLKASGRTSARTAAYGLRCVVGATVGSGCVALGAVPREPRGSVERLGTHRDVFGLDVAEMTPAAFKRSAL